MSVNLIDNYSFESGLAEWMTSGDVSANSSLGFAFERETVAELGDCAPDGSAAILSQLVLVPNGATHFHVFYALRPEVLGLGSLTVEVQFRGSANATPPLPLLRTDVLDRVDAGSLVGMAWETRYGVSGEIPDGTEWARLRFIHNPPEMTLGNLFVDDVVMTTD